MEIIRFDWAIKYILRDKANFGILEGFLSDLLKTPITILELLESEGNQASEQDKLNRVDLLVKNQFGELILIEIQNQSETDYFHRMLYGASRLLTEHLNKGDAYAKIKKVIAVHIVYFDLGQGEDYIYQGQTRFYGLHQGDELRLSKNQQKLFQLENISNIFPEYYVLKVQKFKDQIQDTFDEWMYVLKHAKVEKNFKASQMKLVEKKLNVLKMSAAERQKYNAFLEGLSYEKSMFEINRLESLLEGEQIGMTKGLQQVARQMKTKGFEAKTIAELTGLSEAEIAGLE